MTSREGSPLEPILSIPGTAADHLYREGSARASFWEAVFGSSLRAKRRTHVSALADGTRVFDVPLLELEDQILRSAEGFMTSEGAGGAHREAAALLAARKVQVRLIGLQARGEAVAAFMLRIEPGNAEVVIGILVSEAFASWFAAEGPRLARELLIPFGFTPHPS